MQKYKYVRATKRNLAILEGCPSAGPRPNITGMRNKFWGKDALIVKCGAYAYKVSFDTFLRLD